MEYLHGPPGLYITQTGSLMATKAKEGAKGILIFDAQGRQIAATWDQISEFEFALAPAVVQSLSPGIYMIRYIDPISQSYMYEKVIKQ